MICYDFACVQGVWIFASPVCSSSFLTRLDNIYDILCHTPHTEPTTNDLNHASYYALNVTIDVAMVIITTMVCKIYFPESLERGSPEVQASGTARMSYVRVRSRRGSGDDGNESGSGSSSKGNADKISSSYYSSDNDDESSGEDGGAHDDDFSDEDDSSDDDSEGDREAEGLLLEMEEPDGGFGGAHGAGPSPHHGHRRRRKHGGRSRAVSGGNFLEFDQSTTSRHDVMKRLWLCILMLNVTFVSWGVLQVRSGGVCIWAGWILSMRVDTAAID